MKKDYPFDMFIGLQLLDHEGQLVLNIDGSPHKNDNWITQNLTVEEEIIGVYGNSDTNDFLRSLGFILWKR